MSFEKIFERRRRGEEENDHNNKKWRGERLNDKRGITGVKSWWSHTTITLTMSHPADYRQDDNNSDDQIRISDRNSFTKTCGNLKWDDTILSHVYLILASYVRSYHISLFSVKGMIGIL